MNLGVETHIKERIGRSPDVFQHSLMNLGVETRGEVGNGCEC